MEPFSKGPTSMGRNTAIVTSISRMEINTMVTSNMIKLTIMGFISGRGVKGTRESGTMERLKVRGK